MGHPRTYATWRDESLNAMLSRIAEQSSFGDFDEGLWDRIDLQRFLGLGASRPKN